MDSEFVSKLSDSKDSILATLKHYLPGKEKVRFLEDSFVWMLGNLLKPSLTNSV